MIGTLEQIIPTAGIIFKKMISFLRFSAITVIVIFNALSFSFSQNQESITITTYYPSPFGSYDQLGANIFVTNIAGVATPAEYSNMANGDVRIGRSLIIGPAGSGYAYDALSQGARDLRPADGGMLISGNVRIGATNPESAKLTVVANNFQQSQNYPAWNTAIPPAAIRGISDTGFGVHGYSHTNYGVIGHSVNSAAGSFLRHNGDPAGINPAVELYIQGLNAADGFGASLDFYVENNRNKDNLTASVTGILTNHADNFETSDMSFRTRTYDGTTTVFSEKMRINKFGNVGIGTANPQVKLDLNSGGTIDGVRLGYVSDGFCNSNAQAGTIRYLSSRAKMQYCNGNGWVDLGGGSSAIARCTFSDIPFNPGFKCCLTQTGIYGIRCDNGKWIEFTQWNCASSNPQCENFVMGGATPPP